MSEQPRDPQTDSPRLDLDTPAPTENSAPRNRAENVATAAPTASASPRGESVPSDAPAGTSGYGYGYGYAPQAADSVHLMDYVRVLHKRRWTAITAFILVFGSVTLYTFTATPIYEARAQLLIENQEQNVVQFEQVLDENRSTNDYYQTQYRILQSRALARRTIETEKLWDHPQFARKEAAFSLNPASWIGSAAASVGAGDADPQEAPAESETAAQSEAIDGFLRDLTVSPVRNSRLVEVRFRSPDAALSSRLANALSKQYIEQNLEFKFLATQEATEFLSERMAEQRKYLEQSEQALQQYREKTGAVALQDRQNIVVQRLADLNAAVTRARTERIEKEAVYNQIRSVQSDRAALDTVPAILTNTFIQQLKVQMTDLQRQQAQLAEKLGERHPDMVKVRTAIESVETRISAEVQKVVQALRRDYEAALSNERSLMASLNEQRGEAQELNRASIQYGVLERDTTTNREMFESLLQRAKETDISGDLKTSNIRVVDQAEAPRRQASPNTTNNMVVALFGGLFIGVGLAFLFEYLDSRIKTPEQIKTQLGLPFLGIIPAISPSEFAGSPLLAAEVPHHFAEAFRGIRTNILFSSASEGPKSIVVTSTAPGEGKTVVSANLALSLANAGQRVLLVDTDMRRPKVHETFRVGLEPGLSNLIVGDGRASEAVKRTGTQNLWVLAAGKNPPNPAELLSSKRFADFLSNLRNHFDWIVLDSPPVMAVADPVVISRMSDGIVYVIAADVTPLPLAKAGLSHLAFAQARHLGAILNKVDVKKNSYYYANYYRHDYAEKYTKPE